MWRMSCFWKLVLVRRDARDGEGEVEWEGGMDVKEELVSKLHVATGLVRIRMVKHAHHIVNAIPYRIASFPRLYIHGC